MFIYIFFIYIVVLYCCNILNTLPFVIFKTEYFRVWQCDKLRTFIPMYMYVIDFILTVGV